MSATSCNMPKMITKCKAKAPPLLNDIRNPQNRNLGMNPDNLRNKCPLTHRQLGIHVYISQICCQYSSGISMHAIWRHGCSLPLGAITALTQCWSKHCSTSLQSLIISAAFNYVNDILMQYAEWSSFSLVCHSSSLCGSTWLLMNVAEAFEMNADSGFVSPAFASDTKDSLWQVRHHVILMDCLPSFTMRISNRMADNQLYLKTGFLSGAHQSPATTSVMSSAAIQRLTQHNHW